MIPDSQIHLGHRERMRRKLIQYGGEIFDTYELLEMLLYSVIPVRDTNPISKRLLAAFGDLDGVLSADIEALVAVEGVGAATARYIATAGALPLIMSASAIDVKPLVDYDEIGDYLVDYYKGRSDYAVSALFLDNAMRPIRTVDVYSCDYGKGSVQCKPFLDLAFSLGASCAVIFHNHPYGPLYPDRSDLLTHKIIAEGFKRSGITLLDHYVISGDKHLRIGRMTADVNDVQKVIDQFGSLCIKNDVSIENLDGGGVFETEKAYLDSFLNYGISDEARRREVIELLMERYHSILGILSRGEEELSEVCGAAASGLKLLSYLTSRRYTDKYRSGKKLSDWITEYFKWYFFGSNVETVALALFDKNEKLISVNKISEGTVNASEIVPRRAMETASKAKAKYAVLAHNHPGGNCIASSHDVYATSVVSKAFESIGVKLLNHFIVADLCVGAVEILKDIPTIT